MSAIADWEWNATWKALPARQSLASEIQLSRLSPMELKSLLADRPSDRGRLFGFLKDGLLRAFAEMAYIATFEPDDEIERAWRNPREVERAARKEFGGVVGPVHFALSIKPDFWQANHLDDERKWTGVTWGPQCAVLADWQSARFEAILLDYEYGVEDGQIIEKNERITAAKFFGVWFAKEDAIALLGTLPQTAPRERSSKYNWESAIAAFAAAQWKHDIVPDVHAHGAQAEIERWLTSWFEQNGAEPTENAIRPRARLILQHMLKADKLA